MNWTLVFFEQNDKQTLKVNILGIHFLLFRQSQLERPVGSTNKKKVDWNLPIMYHCAVDHCIF